MLNGWERMIPVGSLSPWFILTQDGKIADVALNPSLLLGWTTGPDLSVLVGTINEFGKHEILGPCGEYFHAEGETTWMVTSPLDGYNRQVGITGSVGAFIISRLSTLYKNGRFKDLVNFPKITITGFVQ